MKLDVMFQHDGTVQCACLSAMIYRCLLCEWKCTYQLHTLVSWNNILSLHYHKYQTGSKY